MKIEHTLDDILSEYRSKIIELHNMKKTKEMLDYKLSIYNDSLIICIYSLLQEGMTKDEKIQKKSC